MEAYQQDILTGFESQLVQASSGKRFANYLIDLVVFYLILFVFGIVLALLSPASINDIDSFSNSSFLDEVLSLLLYGTYMFLIELIGKGRSVGKFITGTKAVNEDGSAISAKTALLRGLSRTVPFEVFSALGSPSYPWHDKWTHTYVIDVKRSQLL